VTASEEAAPCDCCGEACSCGSCGC
jgi:hypothetical protein